MCLTKYISPELILLRITPEDKAALFRIMTECIMKAPSVKEAGISLEEVHDAIIEREKQSSTGIGEGYAFPHARMPELNDLAICLAVLENTIDYGSCDNKPVAVACMVLAPEKTPALALKAMSQVVRLFAAPETGPLLHNAVDSKTVYEYLEKSDADISSPIMARDIMREPLLTVAPDDSLKQITRQMATRQLNVIPVIDENKKILGEISCERLFKLGIPDFFSSLKSVKFICEFDPFEKYFHEEAAAVAKDVMSTKFCTMPPTATILEIVFALSVKRYPKIYIVERGRLSGIIDQSTVLEKIINI